MVQKQRKLFEAPFGFKEGGFTTIFLVVLGFFVELLSGGTGITVPGWPFNAVIAAMLVLLVFQVSDCIVCNRLYAWLVILDS